MYERYRGERGATELLCHDRAVDPPPPRVRGRRVTLVPLLAIFLLFASVLVLFFQVRSFLGHLEVRIAAESPGEHRLRAIGHQMESLRGRFQGALAESVELRLKVLERKIDSGKIGHEDLLAFEQLQKDLELLEKYQGSSRAGLLEAVPQEHSRYLALPQDGLAARQGEMLREVAEMKTLFYFCLAGLATSTVVMVGYYWTAKRRSSRHIDTPVGRLPVLTRSSSGSGAYP